MPRVCTACGHDEREALNRAVVRGAPLRRIAESHGLSESALRRHAASCVPKSLASAENAREAASAERLLADVSALEVRAVALVERAEAEGDVRAAVVALREARECVALRARVRVELRREESVSVPEASALISAALGRVLSHVLQPDRQQAIGELERLIEDLPPDNQLKGSKIQICLGSDDAQSVADLVRRATEPDPDRIGEILEGLARVRAIPAKHSTAIGTTPTRLRSEHADTHPLARAGCAWRPLEDGSRLSSELRSRG
jgi:hypothetical protein